MPVPRPLGELLQIVGAQPSLPFTGVGVGEAYKAGLITSREAQLLQGHSKRSTRGQRLALREARPVTDAQVDKMRAKLDAAGAKLWPDMEAD